MLVLATIRYVKWNFLTFCGLSDTLRMWILGQKSYVWVPTIFEIPQPIWHYCLSYKTFDSVNKKINCILNFDAFKICLHILIFQSIWSLFTISGCQIFTFITSNPSRSSMFFPNWLVFGSTTKRRFITGMKFYPLVWFVYD